MLTEKEKMQRAKNYMLKLANGINPVDDTNMQNDSALKNERLAKCFLYISEVLENAIRRADTSSREKSAQKKTLKKQFEISEQDLQNIHPLDRDCAISELAAEINKITADQNCKKLPAKMINDWLVDKGYLKNETMGGKTRRELTETSAEIGITSKQGVGAFGNYTIVLFSEQAQQYIIDHLIEIADFAKENSNVQGD